MRVLDLASRFLMDPPCSARTGTISISHRPEKKMRSLICALVFVGLSSTIVATACALQTGEAPPKTQQVLDYHSFLDKMRAETKQAEISEQGDLSQPFFSVKAKVVRVNGNDAQVFEYESQAAADAEARRVSSDGASVGTTMITWVSAPHFYKSGKIIVLYIGKEKWMSGALTRVLGPQFAGSAD